MLSEAVERQIDEMIAISDELGMIVPKEGWSKYARSILRKLQDLSMTVFDEEPPEVRLDESLKDLFLKAAAKPNLPSDLTQEEKAQGYYFRNVNGDNIKFSSETGLPMDGQPKAFGADTLQEMISNARMAVESRTTGRTGSKNIGQYSSPYPMDEISAEGENHPCIGFTEGNLRTHKDDRHQKQYEKMTDEEYNEHAKKLLAKKCGPDIWGYRSSDGCICRFNRLTGEFAKGYPGGNIKTCFFPVALGADPLDIDLDYARNYFRKRKEEESCD